MRKNFHTIFFSFFLLLILIRVLLPRAAEALSQMSYIISLTLRYVSLSYIKCACCRQKLTHKKRLTWDFSSSSFFCAYSKEALRVELSWRYSKSCCCCQYFSSFQITKKIIQRAIRATLDLHAIRIFAYSWSWNWDNDIPILCVFVFELEVKIFLFIYFFELILHLDIFGLVQMIEKLRQNLDFVDFFQQS